MQINYTQLITYFIDSYKDSKKRSDLIDQIKELLLQELKWNLDLLDEISSLSKNGKQDVAIKLIEKFEVDVLNVLKQTGIPLSKIVPGLYQPHPTSKYQHLLKGYTTKSKLIYRTYHRLKVNILRIEIQNERGERSRNYLYQLLKESIRVIEE
jgi:hypothetical protein